MAFTIFVCTHFQCKQRDGQTEREIATTEYCLINLVYFCIVDAAKWRRSSVTFVAVAPRLTITFELVAHQPVDFIVTKNIHAKYMNTCSLSCTL